MGLFDFFRKKKKEKTAAPLKKQVKTEEEQYVDRLAELLQKAEKLGVANVHTHVHPAFKQAEAADMERARQLEFTHYEEEKPFHFVIDNAYDPEARNAVRIYLFDLEEKQIKVAESEWAGSQLRMSWKDEEIRAGVEPVFKSLAGRLERMIQVKEPVPPRTGEKEKITEVKNMYNL